jgi:polyisoprenyl-phosphate glycosyltransferase
MSPGAAPEISFVVPVYHGERSLPELVQGIAAACEGLVRDWEVVLVDDGSPDRSWQRIQELGANDPRVKGIKLSRNFGQHHALSAGLEASRGACVIVMDCDLQDDPAYIPALYRKFREGFEIVYTLKDRRAHPFLKNLQAALFFRLFNFLIDDPRSSARRDVGSYSLISRKVADAFLAVRDYHRHYLMVIRWLGFSETAIEVKHRPRPYGRSSYSFGKLVAHAINGIASQSNRLLHLAIGVGLAFFALSIFATAGLIVAWYFRGFLQGWTSVMVMILMSTGCILLCLGIVGLYIGKIFDQVRGRPLYLVDRTVNLGAELELGLRREA